MPLGFVVVTKAVDRQVLCREDGRAFVMSCLRRHQSGDWGDLTTHDAEANDLALVTGARVLSSYPIPEEIRTGAGGGQAGGGAGGERSGGGGSGEGSGGRARGEGSGGGAGGESPGGAGDEPRSPIAEERLWIITEAEDAEGVRSHTTVLFPSDY